MSRETVSSVIFKCDICNSQCTPKRKLETPVNDTRGTNINIVLTVSTSGSLGTQIDVCDRCLGDVIRKVGLELGLRA